MYFPPVLTKEDFVRRYAAGEFGNRSPTWNGIVEWATAYPMVPGPYVEWADCELFHIRNRVAGATTWYNVRKYEMFEAWDYACSKFAPSQLYISAMAPTHLTTLQGELQRSIRGLDLYYSTVKKPMRDSLVEGGRQVSGATAVCLLRSYLDASSYEWVELLLDRYPDHVIEFSAYSRCWGTVPRRNTVIWETRAY